jgi:hypothetical protein
VRGHSYLCGFFTYIPPDQGFILTMMANQLDLAHVTLIAHAASFSTTLTTKPKPEKSTLDPECFLDLKLKAVEPYNHNTSCFVFELPDGSTALTPVTSLVFVCTSGGADDVLLDKKGKPVVCPYTPILQPEHEGELVFLIKKHKSRVIRKYMHEWLKPGSMLTIKGPIIKFPYKALHFSPINTHLYEQGQ